jgi:hypothetical protein
MSSSAPPDLQFITRPAPTAPRRCGCRRMFHPSAFNLTSKGFGTEGARRLVCLTDGSIAIEEVLLREVGSEGRRFGYAVWNYTSPKFRDVRYAVGEFIHTQPAPDKAQVNWTYRFALKEGRDPGRFRTSFLDAVFAEWMRSLLEKRTNECRGDALGSVEQVSRGVPKIRARAQSCWPRRNNSDARRVEHHPH